MKILLVEDDVNLSNDLKHQLLFEKFEVDISTLSAGLYIISVSGDNFVVHKKFLKN